MRKMKNTKGEKGVTLIALAVTIIVMIILTSVAIRSIRAGQLLERGKETKEEIQKVGDDSVKDINVIYDSIRGEDED